MSRAWIVRARGDDEQMFQHGIVTVGWDRVGDLSPFAERAMVHRAVAAAYPNRSASTVNAYSIQLFVFRAGMEIGDLVLLLRGESPDLSLGEISGPYLFRSEAPHQARPVRWLHHKLLRGEVGDLLIDPPASSVVYRINDIDLVARLRELAGKPAETATASPSEVAPDSEATVATSAAYQNLLRNLNYARNLTSAGAHLEQLKVAAFEVTDVYRAAWVQAVAALDHWVHQEIRDRMLAICMEPARPKPPGYAAFELPLSDLEEIQSGRTTLRDVLERRVQESLAYKTYQHPDKIREGLRLVANTNTLWRDVATAFGEQFAVTIAAADVQSRLKEIVHRRNKIAHEYDEDPVNPPSKRDIDAASTMQTIEWLDQLAYALLTVLDQQ